MHPSRDTSKTGFFDEGILSLLHKTRPVNDGEAGMIACQMTKDLFEYTPVDMIARVTLGAATCMEKALKSDINNLFI